jgi:CheY-like chemotaxis protein
MTTPFSNTRVLLVEDESLVAMLVEDCLVELGVARVEVVANLDAALLQVAEGAFDVAIVDVNLGGVLTYPLADALRARDIPFVFATGYGTDGLRVGYENEVTLQKPFTMQDLTRALGRVYKPI